MIKKTVFATLILFSMSSCVSKKIYNDLENKYTDLKKENNNLADENEDLKKAKNLLETENSSLKAELAKIKSERDKLQTDCNATANNLKALQESYNALEKNSSEALTTNMNKNRELLAQLDAKEKALAAEQNRLNKLRDELSASSKRLSELESMIANKDAAMKKLKETLSKALNAFEGKGLTVEQKNGKVYVSMENKLLFQTGSWAVGSEGRKAVVEVGKVLAQNPDITVLIEGHTDNDKIIGTLGSGIENNWDLSTKRATAIVNILAENTGIQKKNLTAAGRGEFAPLMSNDTPDGKAKNRRIEIILTPKLDEISKMLNEF
ncbi:OmpA/MotB family protein [Flavobacterium capsici]|uniref:OmpA family protein n=1 Tax=Flavobacterium capsici TaxID=3075618 RepID=A0AA96F1E7_9FLAO|nr:MULTISPECIES: OmpA family protein [unclassified Flavobacterium]WNM19784.1 OmpA family protein [Flavobacterium sp. PMR2A8]WNM21173.1 OmpA family protein [Flavobacterium sp. PMTSA4]